MFREQDQDVVIFENAVFLKRLPHMYLECVPMPKETGELAPIYFKVWSIPSDILRLLVVALAIAHLISDSIYYTLLESNSRV
jgi:hypothetical protein